MYTEGSNAQTKYLFHRQLQYPEIDNKVWKFFCKARSKNIPLNGPMFLAEANEIALKHNYNKFSASNGWLQRFSIRHQIKFANLHGKSAEVSDEAVDQWKEKLPAICAGYHPRDIFNCDETGVFFCALPQKYLTPNGAQTSGIKVSKDRFSMLVCANALGEKQQLWIISKAKKLHSFPKYISDLARHVTCRNNTKARITIEIFVEFLKKLNNKMKLQDRNILMFLDNCPSHLAISLSNIKLVFYLKNCTSKLQPMDLGVIANLKSKYKRRVHNQVRIMAKTVENVRQFISQLTIFDAILHCKNAWDAMSAETIIKCFNHSGIFDSDASPPCSPESTQEPLEEKDTEFDQYFQNLLGMSWDEYLMMDEELEIENPVCALDASNYKDNADDFPDQDKTMEAMPTPEELLNSLKQVQRFVLGNDKLFDLTDQLMLGIQNMHVEQEVASKNKKTMITSFFKS